MGFDDDTRRRIFERTDGRCHICWEGLCFTNYGRHGRRGAWEVEHSVPKAKGGTDHLNNLYPAHVACNRRKGKASSKSARAESGRSRAPMSRQQKDKGKRINALGGAVVGGLVGLVFGPWGVLVGLAAGGAIGYEIDPEGG